MITNVNLSWDSTPPGHRQFYYYEKKEMSYQRHFILLLKPTHREKCKFYFVALWHISGPHMKVRSLNRTIQLPLILFFTRNTEAQVSSEAFLSLIKAGRFHAVEDRYLNTSHYRHLMSEVGSVKFTGLKLTKMYTLCDLSGQRRAFWKCVY